MAWGKLGAFARAHLPALVVSCKCDASQRQIDPNSIEQVGMVGGYRYETHQTSATSTGSQRRCLNAILSMVSKKKGVFTFLPLLRFFFAGFYSSSLAVIFWNLPHSGACCGGGVFPWVTRGAAPDTQFVMPGDVTFLARYPFCLGLLVDADTRKSDAGGHCLFFNLCLGRDAFVLFVQRPYRCVTFCPMPAHPHAMGVWGSLRTKNKGNLQQNLFSSSFVAPLFLVHTSYIALGPQATYNLFVVFHLRGC